MTHLGMSGIRAWDKYERTSQELLLATQFLQYPVNLGTCSVLASATLPYNTLE